MAKREVEDLTGRRIGRWTVIERTQRVTKRGKRGTYWRCRCDCGWENVVPNHTLRAGKSNSCRRCSNAIIHGAFVGAHWCKVVTNARSRDLELTITPEYANQLYESQGRRCALTGVPIVFSRDGGGRRIGTGTTASLDRIDSRYGYIPGNVRWVHRSVNIMRLDFTDEQFIYWCRLVAERTQHVELPEFNEPPIQPRVANARKKLLSDSGYPANDARMKDLATQFPAPAEAKPLAA